MFCANILKACPCAPWLNLMRSPSAAKTIKVRERALINGKIEGLDFDTSVVPVESLGKANGHDLDAIIGAITMEAWEITVNPKDGSLGLEGLKRREFTEY